MNVSSQILGQKGLRMTVTKCRIALDTNINKPFEMPFTVSAIPLYSFTLVSHSNRNECKKFQRRPLFLGVDCKLHIFKETFSILFPIEMKLPIFLLVLLRLPFAFITMCVIFSYFFVFLYIHCAIYAKKK